MKHCAAWLLAFAPEWLFTLFSSAAFPDRGDTDAAVGLTPALLVLNKMVLASEASRVAVKNAIFPPQDDEVIHCYDKGIVFSPLPFLSTGACLTRLGLEHCTPIGGESHLGIIVKFRYMCSAVLEGLTEELYPILLELHH